mmetsp:Transcript_133694/g.250158  ORF Transcript_133694/g.250158 Transcript_133694/m.250158 type:complete len:701 (+) Transcript_133694:94-2196(+)
MALVHDDASADEVLDVADRINGTFAAFDLDGSGTITQAELERVFFIIDPKNWDKDKVGLLLSSFDKDKDGAISFSEFISWTCSSRTNKRELNTVMSDQATKVARAILEDDKNKFDAFDMDDDHKLSRADLERVLGSLVPETFSAADVRVLLGQFDSCDENKDGQLSVREFVGLVCLWGSDDSTRHMMNVDITAQVRKVIEQEAEAVRKKQLEDAAKSRKENFADLKAGRALLEFLRRYPYLARNSHDLHEWVMECRQKILEGEEEEAMMVLARMTSYAFRTRGLLLNAFEKFKAPGTTCLRPGEVKTMLDYLGFPAGVCDVEELMKAIDKDGNDQINFEEFQVYVGRQGGIYKLFENRRRQLQRSRRDRPEDGESAVADREDLNACGILDNAQSFWRLVVPESELVAVTKLVDCQRKALRHIRQLAAANHEKALGPLIERCRRLDIADEELWAGLAFIREQAPIIVHVNLTKMMQFMENDTNYRNQFETRTSGGCLSQSTRTRWEKALFGGCYDEASGFERPKYGVLNVFNDNQGVMACSQYGDSYMVLKDVRLRITGSPVDSCSCHAGRLSVLDYYAHVLSEWSDKQIKALVTVATERADHVRTDRSIINGGAYKELQIHGEVAFNKHVERLVAHERHRPEEERLKAICEKHGWAFSWMDQDRDSLITRTAPVHKEKLGAREWRERMRLCHSHSLEIKD